MTLFKTANKKEEVCEECGKTTETPYYDYRAKKKGSFEISEGKILCNNCFFRQHKSKKITDKEKTDTSIKVILAMQTKKEKELKDALAKLDKIFDKDEAGDWYSKGNILTNLKRYDDALKCFDEAIFLDTHYVKAWYRKGNMLFGFKKFDDAINCYNNVIGLDSKNKDEKRSWYKAAIIFKGVSVLKKANKDPQQLTPGERILLQNYNSMLDTIEPNIVAEVIISGKKH